MKPALEELEHRRPVWQALSDLFLDTDTSISRSWRVNILAASPYSIDELQEKPGFDGVCAHLSTVCGDSASAGSPFICPWSGVPRKPMSFGSGLWTAGPTLTHRATSLPPVMSTIKAVREIPKQTQSQLGQQVERFGYAK